MTWWDGRMAGLDLETTSPDPREARIVTASVVFVGGGAPTQAWSAVADPGVEIPAEAAAIHGYTTERARAEGWGIDAVLDRIVAELWRAIAERLPIVAMNARYDFTVLDRELRRRDRVLEAAWLARALVIDPRVIDQWLDRYRPGKRTLTDLCAEYRVVLDQAHDAAFDAIAACRLAYRIGKSGRVIRRAWNAEMHAERVELQAEWERVRGDLTALHEAQARWAWDETTRFAQYVAEHPERYAESGTTRESVLAERGWPINSLVPIAATRQRPRRELSEGGDDSPEWTI